MYQRICPARPSSFTPRALGLQIGLRNQLPPIATRIGKPAHVKRLSTSRTTYSSNIGRTPASGEASGIIFATDQPAELPNRLSKLSAWTLSSSKMGITRQFTFPTFAAAWRFMSLVADECKIKRHHPSWSNIYNQVTIEWTTHKPKGLSIKDVEMAEFCDRTADEIDLKAQSQKTGTTYPG